MAEAEKETKETDKPKAETPAGSSKHPKVTQMNRAQVEAALAKAVKQMGGLDSRYAKSLIARKELLDRMQASG